jgi:hypothetical protein
MKTPASSRAEGGDDDSLVEQKQEIVRRPLKILLARTT